MCFARARVNSQGSSMATGFIDARAWRAIVLAVMLILTGCGGDGDSSSGGGGSTSDDPTSDPDPGADPATDAPPDPIPSAPPAPMQPDTVGPNLNGQWAGYYKSEEGNYQNLTATITHTGRRVTITTSMPPGIIHRLVGQIDGGGNMLLYDQFDNEDWTTLYGPASSKSINLADYVIINGSRSDTNIIILKR